MKPRCLRYGLLFVLVFALVSDIYAQRGKIIRPASGVVLDPNSDGFVSKTVSGFSNDGFYLDEFELAMFGIPKLEGDVPGDNIGKICGITDLIPDSDGFSVYAVRDAADNLIFRFRVGQDNPSVEAWTILLDADGNIGSDDPNATAGNPGFEIDITLIKRNNSGVLVYDIDGRDDCPSPLLFYEIDSHFQVSIADEVSCGDPDYFYDFYVPFAEISTAFGIDINTGLRYVAVTNVSATCAMGGNISDISGVDNNDPEYSGCVTCAFEDLISNQCPTPIVDLCETCAGFEKDKVSAPMIDEPIRAGQTVVTGSTIEDDIFIRLQVFTNTAAAGSPPTWGPVPREEVGVYATGNTWTVPLASPLLDFDRIVAIAQKDEFTLPCGANDDNSSSTSVTVVSPNTPPVALDQNVVVIEDNSLPISLTGTDAENDPLLYAIVAGPAHGTLQGNPPTVTYTPVGDYSGSDSFTFTVNDGIFTSASPGTVTVSVTPVNDSPSANDLHFTTPEDTPLSTTLTATDADNDALIFSVITPPVNGSLSGSPPALTYTPNQNYFGEDTFTFSVNDGQEDSGPATVSITITPVGDDAPQANAQAVTTPEDTPLPITLSGSDPDLDDITYEIVTPPAHGTLTGTAPDVTYRPHLNFSGNDSFTFRVTDGTLFSPQAAVDINVTPVNDPPVADGQRLPYDLNTPRSVLLTGSDIDGDPITFIVISQPSNGILSGTVPNLTYTPDPGFTGNDQFAFQVNDGTANSAEAVIELVPAPVSNVAPVASDQDINGTEDTPAQIQLVAVDGNGDVLTYSITESPVHGVLSGSGPNVTYAPDPDYSGSDVFKFRAHDGTLSSNEATVNITIAPVNDPPIANSQTVTTDENTAKLITLTGSDPDGGTLSFAIATLPSAGSLTLDGAEATYTPSEDYTGSDHFTFRVNDGSLTSAPATVSIVVNSTGSPPTATDLHVTTQEETPVDVDLSASISDPDGDPVSHAIVDMPRHGTAALNGTVVTYTPEADYFGRDTLTFRGSDGISDSNTGELYITVTGINDPPVATDSHMSTDEDNPVVVVLPAEDVDGGELTYTVLAAPHNGTLSGTAPDLTYTPKTDFAGNDTFTFKVNDGSSDSNIATISLTVTPVNDPPIITPFAGLSPTKEDSLLRVCMNVVDVDGDPVSYGTPVNTKGGGTMTRQPAPFDFCYIFLPRENYNGESDWNLLASDPHGEGGTAPARIIIHPVNDQPVAFNEYTTVKANGTLAVDVLENDVPIASPYQEFYDIYEADSADVVSVVNLVSGPFHGTASLADDRTILYSPGSFTFVGADSVKYEVCDSGHPSLCVTAVVFIDVTENDFGFKVYEGVSPNNDGLNDYMHIEGIHRHANNLVRIFDRFNNMVWERANYDNETVRWEGDANRGLGRSRLPDGTYYYTVYLEDTGKLLSGYVVLKEN